MAETYEITTIVLRSGLDQNRINITPIEGELLYIIDTKSLYVGDGITPGGNRISGGNISIGDISLAITAGDGLIGGGSFGDFETVIKLGTPTTLSGSSINYVSSSSHTHELDVTDRRDITNNYQLLLAKALKDHIDNDPHSGGGNTIIPNHDDLIGFNIRNHIDHQSINIIAGNGLTGGGNLMNSVTLNMLPPLILDGQSINNINTTGHSHQLRVTDQKTVNDNRTLLLAKGLHDHLQNDPHVSLTHVHDHNTLVNYEQNRHIDHSILNITAGNGLSGGGILTENRTISLGSPSSLSGTTQNTTTINSHTHQILVTDRRDVTNNYEILLAKALKDHIQFEQHGSGSGTDHNHDHNLLLNYHVNRHIDHSIVSIDTNNGLTGGGNLTETRTIGLIQPGTLSGITINNNSGNHTHELLVTDARNVTNNTHLLLAKALKDHIDQDAHVIPDGSNHIHDHNLLVNYDINRHIDHSGLSLIAGDGLSGGGILDLSRTISLNTPGTLSGITVNNSQSNHTHELLVTDARNVTNNTHLLLAKALKDHIDNEPHISLTHNHNHDLLTNVNPDRHINHQSISINTNNGLTGGGNLTETRTIGLIQPGTLSGITINNNSGNHTHELLVTDARNVTNNTHLLLAKALKDHIDNEPHTILDSTNHTHHHDLLDGFNINHHIDHSEINIIARNGLIGGGYINNNINIDLGNPTTLNGTTINEVTENSHTHRILCSANRDINDNVTLLLAKGLKEHIDNDAHVIPDGSNHVHDHNLLNNINDSKHIDHSIININGGNGLSGGGPITSTVLLHLDTPSTITGVSTNIVTSNSHTHAIKVTHLPLNTTDDILLSRGLYQHEQLLDHIDHSTIFVLGGAGLSGGGPITSNVSISLGLPSTITGVSQNSVFTVSNNPPSGYESHSHMIDCSFTSIDNNNTLLLAKGLYDHEQIHSYQYGIIFTILANNTVEFEIDNSIILNFDFNKINITVFVIDGDKYIKSMDSNFEIYKKLSTNEIGITNLTTNDFLINIIISG